MTLHDEQPLTPRRASRREFLQGGAALLVLPVLCACGGASGDATAATGPLAAPAASDAFVVDGRDVVITLARVPSLASDDSAAVLLSARVIVVRVTADTFRAFSVECPHAGCGVSIVDRGRLLCPCHGSVFDFVGQRVEGPAPRGLTPLDASYSAASGTLRVRRG